MRMSCNGCRVLRKGCSDDCSIRPCLQWIKTPEAQANATVFLAKFYGRAGLLNLINAGPDHLRPAVFRSLLYEACGRIVNPVYGSVGLLWSGSWHLCQTAVEAVLKGDPITQMSSDTIKSFDIRHVAKDGRIMGVKRQSCDVDLAERKKPKVEVVEEVEAEAEAESSTSHEWEAGCSSAASSGRDSEETAEGSMVTSHDEEVALDLTLGPAGGSYRRNTPSEVVRREMKVDGELVDTCQVNLALDLAAA